MTGKKENARLFSPFARWDEVTVAITFLTRLPLPYREASLAHSAWAYPLAGVLVGGMAGVVLWIALMLDLPPLAAAFLALGMAAMLTGALHEDGLADCADGFWGGATPERRLEIMRDSRSGAYGVLALIVTIGLKAALIAGLAEHWGAQPVWMMLIATHVCARSALPLAMTALAPAGKSGLAAMAGRPNLFTALLALLLALALSGIVLNVTPIWMPLALIAATLATGLCIGALAKAKLGGLNGDCLGGMEQISEIACLLVLAAVLGT